MKNKKLIIISIISSLLVGLIVYILFNPHYYILKATIDSSYNYASGVLTNNMFKGSMQPRAQSLQHGLSLFGADVRG